MEKSKMMLEQVKLNILDWSKVVIEPNKSVILIGTTGEGKSALANYLVKNRLYAKKDKFKTMHVYHKSTEKTTIGHSLKSQTTIPNNFVAKDGTIFWDCPGFNDNKGEKQDILNNFYIKTLFSKIPLAKIMLVVSQKSIEGRAREFLDILRKIEMFFRSSIIFQSFILVVTKGILLDPNVIKNHLLKLLQQFSNELSYFQKKIVNYLASEQGKVQIFPTPQKQGEIEMQSFKNIWNTIYSIKYIQTPEVDIAISNDTRMFLVDFSKVLNDSVRRDFKQINKNINKKISGQIQKSVSNNNLKRNVKEILSSINDIINGNNGQELFEKYQKLMKKLGINSIQSLNIKNTIGLIDLINQIDKRNQFLFNDVVLQLFDTRQSIRILIQQPQAKICEQILCIYGSIIGIQQIRNKIDSFKSSKWSSISIFAYNTIFIDSDLQLPGVTISILSPNWIINGERTISLKGKNGDPVFKYDKKRETQDGTGMDGRDGRPGLPGHNGGNFLGIIMNKNNKFYNFGALTIDVSGGNGGAGQDGENGASGRNGKDGDFNGIKQRNQKYLIKRQKYGWDNKDIIGKVVQIGKMFATFNGQVKETYQSIGQVKASKGGNAGAGGIGGIGGRSGKIKLLNFQNLEINTVKFNGKNGSNGQHGNPGKGGRNGNIYRGQYVNQLIFSGLREEGGDFDSQNATSVVATVSGNIAATGLKLATIQGGKQVTQQIAKESLSGAFQNTMMKSTKIVAQQLLTAARKSGVIAGQQGLKVATKQIASTSTGILGGITSFGAGLLVQGVLSSLSSYVSSDWLVQPHLVYNQSYEPSGRIPKKLNEIGCEVYNGNNYNQEEERVKVERLYKSFLSNFEVSLGKSFKLVKK